MNDQPVRIPLFATRSAIEPLFPEITDRQRRVIESGRYILGPEVEAFETEFATYVGREHCVAVANGTEALTIALRASGLGPGDEVVVPAATFFASAEGCVNMGAHPVFCDVDPRARCMSAATAEAAITSTTRALLPVHLFGNPAPMDELRELATAHDLILIADAAQAAGAKYRGRPAGSFGDAATYSFYPGKNLGAFGDGGAIVTDDEELAAKARLLRDHGASERWHHVEVGYNSRLDELQAAALRVLLPHLDEWTMARGSAADAYENSGLGELVETPVETPEATSAQHLYVICTERRDRLAELLADEGIESRAYYTTPMHLQPALAEFASSATLPESERLASDRSRAPDGTRPRSGGRQ